MKLARHSSEAVHRGYAHHQLEVLRHRELPTGTSLSMPHQPTLGATRPVRSSCCIGQNRDRSTGSTLISAGSASKLSDERPQRDPERPR